MKRVTLIIIASLCCSMAAYAQGPAFLDFKADARSLGVAGASAVKDAGAFSVWDNPAASAFSDRTFAAGAAYGMYQPSTLSSTQMGVAGYGRIGSKLSITAGYRYHTSAAYEMFDEEGVFTGTFTPKAMQGTVGAAYRVIPSLSVSLTASFINSSLAAGSAATAVSADLGLYFSTGGFRAALVAANIGSGLDYGDGSSSLPSRVSVGAGYLLTFAGNHHIEADLQGDLTFSAGTAAAVGLEYGFKSLFHVSGGYRLGLGENLPSYATVGAGLSLFGVGVDFAYILADNPLGGSMLVNLTYAF